MLVGFTRFEFRMEEILFSPVLYVSWAYSKDFAYLFCFVGAGPVDFVLMRWGFSHRYFVA